jgi:intracellular multiplication protein IcmP
MADQKTDQTNELLMIIGVIAAAAVGIYWFYGNNIKYVYLTLKLWELKLIVLFYPNDLLLRTITYIQETPISKWTLTDVMLVGKQVGMIINVPFVALLGYFSYNIWKKNPIQRFRRTLSMQTLKESEQKIWPYIAPMVHVDLMKESFDKGPYAMALRPYDYAVKYKLLLDETNVNSMDKVRAEKLFVSQLGKLWDTFDKLKSHEQALLVIFAAQGCGDKKTAIGAINAIAISAAESSKKMPDFSSIKPLMKYLEDPRVVQIISRHAYVYTMMASMLEFARTTGVLPSSYITWLKSRDRVLWYLLNCVGRQVAFVEVAGIFGHWKAEQIAKHKLEAPFVSKAVDGLERGLTEVKVVVK